MVRRLEPAPALTLADAPRIDHDPTPTLWVATDLSMIVRPRGELGPLRRDLVDGHGGTLRVYRYLDGLWLGWLADAWTKAEAQYAAGRIDPQRWATLSERWSAITTWAAELGISPRPRPSSYPAPTPHDRWQDRLVEWRRRYPEYVA